ncbi:hypothetical protein SY83_12880 [Paenibacillus swuensis]|uniref:DUF559 domain-containing protein n=1 Tax=Paenibacillus swuensis TaxID=1178515 RepID=A0A172TIY1_9BACL|nr:hypothetical protein [Paenibacillus swuensis]ANE47015.1 hypothetical protein SY83_12880 [Paenibacillus swuensis]
MSSFKLAYEGWMEKQIQSSSGERRRRLLNHGHAERVFLETVWWPAVGRFDCLQAEYEVMDYRDRTRYLDFVYLRAPYRVCLEIDGYETHGRSDRYTFSDDRRRQNGLVVEDWKVLRYSFDDVKDQPRQCQLSLQQWMGRWFGTRMEEQKGGALGIVHTEIIRFMSSGVGTSVSLQDIQAHLNIGEKLARKHLRELMRQQWVAPVSGTQRIHAYKLAERGR